MPKGDATWPQMTGAPQKTLGQIAHEAGERIGAWSRTWAHMGQGQRDDWEVVAAAVAAAEREACARLCEDMGITTCADSTTAHELAAAIRGQGNTP